jgi:hypothetical protein
MPTHGRIAWNDGRRRKSGFDRRKANSRLELLRNFKLQNPNFRKPSNFKLQLEGVRKSNTSGHPPR